MTTVPLQRLGWYHESRNEAGLLLLSALVLFQAGDESEGAWWCAVVPRHQPGSLVRRGTGRHAGAVCVSLYRTVCTSGGCFTRLFTDLQPRNKTHAALGSLARWLHYEPVLSGTRSTALQRNATQPQDSGSMAWGTSRRFGKRRKRRLTDACTARASACTAPALV